MIELLFRKMNEKILIIIEGNRILFGSTGFGAYLASIEGLQLSYEGVILEHPDLKDNPTWRIIAVQRFKEKISSFKTENEKAKYIIEDLSKHGFELRIIKKQGFRPEGSL